MRNPVKLPGVRQPLKNMRAKISERNAGAGHKILDRARDDDVVGTYEICDPRGDVHCNAPYVVVRKFDFASVNACANRYSERVQRGDDGLDTTEAVQPVLRERRVVWDLVLEI